MLLSGLLYLAIGLALVLSGSRWESLPLPLAGAPVSPWWHVVPLAVACAAILIQRRHLMAGFALASAAVVADAALGLHLGVFLAWADTAYTLARRGESRPSRWGLGLSTLAVLSLGIVLSSRPDGLQYAVRCPSG